MANPNKNGTPAPKKEDTVVLRAGMDLLLSCTALILLYFFGKSYATNPGWALWCESGLLKYVAIGSAVLVGAGVVLMALKKRHWVIRLLTCVFAVVTVAATVLYRTWVEYLPVMNFLVIAAGALYLVRLLYPVDFFLIALISTGCGAGYYLLSTAGYLTALLTIFFLLMAVVMAVSVWMAKVASGAKGIFRLGKVKFRLYRGDRSPVLLYGFCAAHAACILASAFAGAAFAQCCVYVSAGALFIAACYYTIRLN